jgi:serine/threonine protein kinase
VYIITFYISLRHRPTRLKGCHTLLLCIHDTMQGRNVKLVDFGFSACVADGRKLHVFCGTPSYIPPEVIKRGEYAGKP